MIERKAGRPVVNTERDKLIIKQAKQGKTYTEIGKFFGVSRQRIAKIVAKYNLTQ